MLRSGGATGTRAAREALDMSVPPTLRSSSDGFDIARAVFGLADEANLAGQHGA
jgi:hypothetical protein